MSEHDFTRIVGCMECTTYEIKILDTSHHGDLKFLWTKWGGEEGRKAQTSFEINNVLHALKNREPEERGKSCFK